MWTDRIIAIITPVIIGALAYYIYAVASGRIVYEQIFHASSTTDCLIVRNGARVAVDCWIVEGEHEHGTD